MKWLSVYLGTQTKESPMVDTLSKKDIAFASLQERILKLELAPGTTLEEGPLCAEFGLSRTPMRELLQKLSGLGYITLSAGRGATVADINLQKIRQFFQAAPLLHALIARLAADAADSNAEQALRIAQANMNRARVSRNAASLALADHQFHVTLCQIADNPFLGPSLERLLIEQTRMSQGFYGIKGSQGTAQIDKSLAEHEALVDAILRKDAGLAVAIAMAHWEPVRDFIEQNMQPEPLMDEGGLLDDLS